MASRACTNCGHLNPARAIRCEQCGTHFPRERSDAERPDLKNHFSAAPIPSSCNFEGCRYPAAYTENTRGGGPWYCAAHARDRGGPMAAQVAGESEHFKAETVEDRYLETARAARRFRRSAGLTDTAACVAHFRRMRAELGTRKPGRRWAEQLRDREAAGEQLSDLQKRFWREALRAPEAATTQPDLKDAA